MTAANPLPIAAFEVSDDLAAWSQSAVAALQNIHKTTASHAIPALSPETA